ncbi:MAG: trimeric autotransporter adhesin, partial [Gaiellaceae bacterium]|nr:trimeric autotransporter adhesin [Gaiellaceae bacterium]
MQALQTARRGLPAALTAGAFLALAGATGATTGALPGGTSIGAAITSPADGSTLPAGPVALTGTAQVGAGVPVANTLVIYVIDVSGSTAAVQPTTLCGNQSVYDNHANTTLDCELLAVRNLNAAAIGNGTVSRVGAIGFGGGATVGSLADAQILDLSSDAGDAQLLAPDSNVSPVPDTGFPFSFPAFVPTPTNDVQRVLASAYTAGAVTGIPAGWPVPSGDGGFMLYAAKEWVGNTNYWAAVEKIKTLAATSTLTNKIAVFLSDGASTVGGPANQHVNAALADLAGSGVRIYTYAVGPSALCNPPFPNFGTLEEISVATGTGHCVPLPNPADATSVVPGVIAAKLTAVRVTVDMGAPFSQATTPAIPSGGLTGPTTVSFTRSLTGLAPGSHTVCVNADGSDGGGAGTIQTCTHFTVLA